MSDDGQDRGQRPKGTPEPASASGRKPRGASARSGDRTRPTGAGSIPGKTRTDRQPTRSLPSRVVRFLREVVAELRKVIWPTRKQEVTYTAVVLVFVGFMVAFVASLDFGLSQFMFFVFG